ncbi:SET domain-containing protein-lysine N-methyltransferase [Deltaproteobacteria bacterium TL4]
MTLHEKKHSASEVKPHVHIQETSKGKGVFSSRDYLTGETILIGRRTEDAPGQTIYSLQMDFNRHVHIEEPACFVNHSCEPNTGVRNNQFGCYDFVALRGIKGNEEITFDYETTEYESITLPDCLCGSSLCRKKIQGFRFRKEFLKKRYGIWIADYLKKQQEDFKESRDFRQTPSNYEMIIEAYP